jgi:phosphatidylglycerol:prolipoprotein diacylglycerol transferase
MIAVDVDPILVHLGPLMVSWYGLAVAAAPVAGVWLARREARHKGIDPRIFASKNEIE